MLVEEFLLVVLLEEHSNKRFHHSFVLEDNLVLVPVVDKHSIDMLVEHQERHPLLETVVEEVHLVLVDSSMEIEDLALLEEDRIDWASLVVDAFDSDCSSLAVVLVAVVVHRHPHSDILVDTFHSASWLAVEVVEFEAASFAAVGIEPFVLVMVVVAVVEEASLLVVMLLLVDVEVEEASSAVIDIALVVVVPIDLIEIEVEVASLVGIDIALVVVVVVPVVMDIVLAVVDQGKLVEELVVEIVVEDENEEAS